MNAYKVHFVNGDAVSASLVKPGSNRRLIAFDTATGKKNVLWYIIECDTEDEAITVADKVVKEIWTECYE